MHPGKWLTFKEASEHCGDGWSKDTLERRRDDGKLPSSRQRDDGNRTWEVCHQDLIQLGACDCEPFEIVGPEETTTHGPIDFGQRTGFASQQWSMACQYADNEVKGILTRTLLGRTNSMLDGCWPESPDYAPPHCDVVDRDGKKNLLVPSLDADKLELARGYVRLAAEAYDRNLAGNPMSSTEILDRLSSDYGARTPDGKPLTELTSHETAVYSRLKWVPPMFNGAYRRTQELPLNDLTPDDVLGQPVWRREGTDGDDCLVTPFVWDLPPLDGIDEHTWDKAVAYVDDILEDPSERRRGATQDTLPLGRIFRAFSTDGREGVFAPDGSSYRLRRLDDDGNLTGSPTASITAAQLHSRIVEAIIAACEQERIELDEINLPVLSGRSTAEPPSEVKQLQQRRTELEEEIAKLQAWLDDKRFPEAGKPELEERVQELEDDLADVEDELADLAETIVPDATVEDAQVQQFADLLAVTEATSGPLPREVRRMWAGLIVDGTVSCELWDPWAEFEFRLRLRTTGGEALSTPITFMARNDARGQRQVGDDKVKRDRYIRVHLSELVRRLCQDGLSVEELAARRGDNPRTLGQSMAALWTGSLDNSPYPAVIENMSLAKAALDAPPAIRAVLYDFAANRDESLPWIAADWDDGPSEQPRNLPDRLDGLTDSETRHFLKVLSARYFTQGETWNVAGWSRGGERERRALLGAVRNGTVETVADALEVMGWSNTSSLHKHLPGYAGSSTPLIEVHPDDEDLPFDHRRLRARRCPNCGHDELHALPVPEVEGEVACWGCRRVVAVPDVRVPDPYFRWWEGLHGRKAADSRDDEADVAGTTEGDRPPPATPARQQRKRRLDNADRAQSPLPAAEACQVTICDRNRAPRAHKYCVRHQDRTVRARDIREAQRQDKTCAFPQCPNAPRPKRGRSRGRPTKYCRAHADSNRRKQLLADRDEGGT